MWRNLIALQSTDRVTRADGSVQGATEEEWANERRKASRRSADHAWQRLIHEDRLFCKVRIAWQPRMHGKDRAEQLVRRGVLLRGAGIWALVSGACDALRLDALMKYWNWTVSGSCGPSALREGDPVTHRLLNREGMAAVEEGHAVVNLPDRGQSGATSGSAHVPLVQRCSRLLLLAVGRMTLRSLSAFEVDS